jgi:transposase-like protein
MSLKAVANRPSVAERVGAALALLERDGRASCVTVSEICRRAGVSRANLYATHPNLIAEILGNRADATPKPSTSKALSSTKKHKSAEKASEREKALLYLCLELKVEVEHLRVLQATGSERANGKSRRKPEG